VMLADAPHYENKKEDKQTAGKGGKGSPKSLAGFFQSRLQEQ
jgi:hypothetical protein